MTILKEKNNALAQLKFIWPKIKAENLIKADESDKEILWALQLPGIIMMIIEDKASKGINGINVANPDFVYDKEKLAKDSEAKKQEELPKPEESNIKSI